MSARRRFTAEFKVKVALEAIQGQRTVAELAARHELHPNLFTQWKRQAIAVGNFGSEDRMDYTIIGGAVNLASRLEEEATPGTVLNSFETFAHVKDVIECEELGQLRVKGIADPIATFRVIDLKANLEATLRAIHTELPHLRIDAEPDLMSSDERDQAALAVAGILHSASFQMTDSLRSSPVLRKRNSLF